MTAVIYARYSSDSQREASIEGQLRDCKDYAEKNGITVVGTYIDRAYSAKTDDRPDFQRMIKDSGKKIFDVVLVWKLDRFARNRFDAVNYKYQLEKNGVHLVSAMEPISQGPEGIMVESMLIGMAEYYSAELALKVARGERENALQCKYNGGVVPLGFTIGKEDRLYHIDPETAPIVQEIFTRYADGEPAEKIAASLNERGLRTRTGKPFVKNSFFQIFRNRRYIGEYRYKDIVTPGGIPAIVDKDLFDRVQQRFEQNKIAHGRPAKEDVSYLLTTKLFCGKCGTLMGGESGTSHMGNTYYYYKCGNAKRHGKAHCDLKAIRKEPLERFVVDTAIKVIFSDEIIERLIDLVMEAQQKENTRLPVLKDQLRDTEKRLANLLEAIEQGILTPTTKQRLDELEARKEALNTSILEEELKKPVLTREWMRFWFEKFRKGDVGSTEHQRQIIDTFVNSVYVFDDRVVLNFNFTDDAKTISREEVLGSSAVDNAPPWRVFLQHLKGCKNTRFLYSEFTGGVVDDYAFSCIYGHFRDRQGQHRWNLNRSDAVIVDAKPLLPYAVDLLRIEYFDLLNQFVQHPGRQFPRSGVLADKTDKHIRCHGTAALLLYLGAELFYFLRQLLLLVLIPPGHFCEAVIGELAGNIILIDALKKAVQFFITGKERS